MPPIFINCYPTNFSTNHQTARDVFFDQKLAHLSLEKTLFRKKC